MKNTGSPTSTVRGIHMSDINVRSATGDDWDWIDAHSDGIGGPMIVSCGQSYVLREHEGFIASRNSQTLGFAILRQEGESFELLAIAATEQRHGVGKSLMAHCEKVVRQRDGNELWLVTTNDNLDAIRFYQRLDYALHELHKGAFAEVRRIKQIEGEVIGHFGIPIRDELVFRKAIV